MSPAVNGRLFKGHPNFKLISSITRTNVSLMTIAKIVQVKIIMIIMFQYAA